MSKQFPQYNQPEVQFISESQGQEVGVNFDATRAEFARDASLGIESMRAGDVLTLVSDTYSGELTTELPVREVRRGPLVHGKSIGNQVIVGYNGGPATLDESRFSTVSSMRKGVIQAGLYPVLRVPDSAGGRPTEETLDRTISFKLERPNNEGRLTEVPLNALDTLEPYDSPNTALIGRADETLKRAIDTILPGVDLKYGVRGKVTAGDLAIGLVVSADSSEVSVLNKTARSLTKLSRYPNGSLGVTVSEVSRDDLGSAEKALEWGDYLTERSERSVKYNFNSKRKDLDNAVTVSLSDEDVKAMNPDVKAGYTQTIYGDGVLSNTNAFEDAPTILALRDGKPILLGNPPQEFEPVKAAQEVMNRVASALQAFDKARASGEAAGSIERREKVQGGLVPESLELPMPSTEIVDAQQGVKRWLRLRQAARALLGLP